MITRCVLVDYINQSNAFKADLAQQNAHNEPVDDQHVINAHQQAYQNNDAGGMSAGNLGAAAAMQVSAAISLLFTYFLTPSRWLIANP